MNLNPASNSHFGHHGHPHHAHSGAAAVALAPVLSANVLVLNKFYQAIRVINVRRAFSLLLASAGLMRNTC